MSCRVFGNLAIIHKTDNNNNGQRGAAAVQQPFLKALARSRAPPYLKSFLSRSLCNTENSVRLV